MLTLLALHYTVLCLDTYAGTVTNFSLSPPFGFLSIVATDGRERTDIP